MAEEKRPEWMTNISSLVDPDEYLLGRKIDKTFELSQKEKADKAREARIELLAKDKIKLSHDPILDLERRKQQLKIELIKNPVMMKQFRDKLLKGEHSGDRGPSDDRGSRDHRDPKISRNSSADRDLSGDRDPRNHRYHRSTHNSSGDRDHKINRNSSGDRPRVRDRDHHDHGDLCIRRDNLSHRSDREVRDDHRALDSRDSGAGIDRPNQFSSSKSSSHHRKGKVQVHGAKPEMPAFLQKIKEQMVANEDNERRMRSKKKREERLGVQTHDDDEPAVVKLNDDDLTEAEYKRLKRDLETQYKIPDSKQSDEKRISEDLDIDQFIKSDRSLVVREDQKPSVSRARDHRPSYPRGNLRDERNSSSQEPSRVEASSKHRKVLSYESSSDDD